MKKIIFVSFILIFNLALSGCFGNKGALRFQESSFKPVSDRFANLRQKSAPSFADVQNVIFKPKCQTCHDSGNIQFATYQQVMTNIEAIKKAVLTDKNMPPKNGLASADLDFFRKWIDSGASLLGEDDGKVVPLHGSGGGQVTGPDFKTCSKLKKSDWDKIFKMLERDDNSENAWEGIEKSVYESVLNCQKVNEDVALENQILGCFNNLQRFVKNQRVTHSTGHHMQFIKSDAEYLASRPREFLALPADLKNGLPADWESMCKKNQWTCVRFVSKSLPNPNKMSFKRLLVVVPGNIFDQWMLFTMDKDNEGDERLIDFMAVEKAKLVHGQVVPHGQAKVHFAEYWRDGKGKNPIFREKIASCYKCHPSGMKEIVPAYGSVNEKGKETVEYVNKWMASYGKLDWGSDTIAFNDYGPAMGKKQGCTTCHNGETRGILNAAHMGERSRHQIYFKMAQDLTMPPDLQKNKDYAPLLEAMAKADMLTEEEKIKLYAPMPLHPLFANIAIYLGHNKGPTAVSNENLLDFLKKKRAISPAEHKEAKAILKILEEKGKKDFEDMKADYKPLLKDWLMGGHDSCRSLFQALP